MHIYMWIPHNSRKSSKLFSANVHTYVVSVSSKCTSHTQQTHRKWRKNILVGWNCITVLNIWFSVHMQTSAFSQSFSFCTTYITYHCKISCRKKKIKLQSIYDIPPHHITLRCLMFSYKHTHTHTNTCMAKDIDN